MKKRLFVLLVLLPLLAAGGGQYTIPRATGAVATAAVTPTLAIVHSATMTNCNYTTTCTATLPYSPTSGNLILFIVIQVNPDTTITIGSLSGAGCPSSFTAVAARVDYPGYMSEYVFWGVAAGTGPCAIPWTAATATVNAPAYFEISGQSAGTPIDAYGTYSGLSPTTITFSANSATTLNNDLAVVDQHCYSSGNTPTASGWTANAWNNGFGNNFYQTVASSGTTESFTGGSFGGSSCLQSIAYMVIVKP